MSFLTPLYILGLAAISLPILFHLIRRTPRGVQPFSSLMFIRPTPPRLTRRSRLDQWLLLLLRAAVIGLLAFAFARPFLRFAASTDLADVSTRLYAVLVDTSASMQRDGLWQQVEEEVEQVLRELGPHDRIALYAFSRQPGCLASLAQSASLSPAARRDLIRRQLGELKPGWAESGLADAMILAADDLDATVEADQRATLRQLIVISDLQQGCILEPLESYQWPQSVKVQFRMIQSRSPDNAAVALLDSLDETNDERGVRVRVTNAEDARQQQFEVGWAGPADRPLGPRVAVAVPAGESRVVHVPRLAPEITPTHLYLTGDDHDFDNRFYVAHRAPAQAAVVYCGADAQDDPDQLLYYLARAVTNDPWQPVELITSHAAARDALRAGKPLLAVITDLIDAELQEATQQYLASGGTALVVLTRPAMAEVAQQLTGTTLGDVTETKLDDYALWSDMDFDNRLLRPFANPQFSDFSQIHFWAYHRVAAPADGVWKPVVRFDNGDLALAEAAVGKGWIYLLTTTWRPADSQLARSSKFVPWLLRLMNTDDTAPRLGFRVGDSIDYSPARGDAPGRVTKPDGTVVPLLAGRTTFDETDCPGLYQIQDGERARGVAINTARAESLTASLDLAQLEQRGIAVGDGSTFATELAALRQLRDVELESRQGVWQWLIATALVLLIVETVVAARRSVQHTADSPAGHVLTESP